MATAAQISANRMNAQHSSRNAVKHGLSSPFTVLAHEDQDEFNQLIDCLTDEHQPANPHQAFLIDQLAIGTWNLARAQRLQTKAFEQLASPAFDTTDPDARIVARMFEANPNVLTTIQRYVAQAERSYYKAYRELKTAKQIQTEAELVVQMDTRSMRSVNFAGNPPKQPAQNKANAAIPVQPAKPSLRSQMPENLALCL